MNFKIVPYTARYRDAFYSINAAWINEFFTLESEDERVLTEPERAIIEIGGAIYMAVDLDDGVAIGAVSLVNRGSGSFELSKMGVIPDAQGRGVGRAMLKEAIECFHFLGGEELFLETSSILSPAIGLYESVGFVKQKQLRPGSKYARADVYMVWEPPSS
ncbi:MAG: GNAT family N-acetyltransferase [Verrucomicrobiota bacterium]